MAAGLQDRESAAAASDRPRDRHPRDRSSHHEAGGQPPPRPPRLHAQRRVLLHLPGRQLPLRGQVRPLLFHLPPSAYFNLVCQTPARCFIIIPLISLSLSVVLRTNTATCGIAIMAFAWPSSRTATLSIRWLSTPGVLNSNHFILFFKLYMHYISPMIIWRDPEMLVTASDDYTLKIWRSRSRCRRLNIETKALKCGLEHRRRGMRSSWAESPPTLPNPPIRAPTRHLTSTITEIMYKWQSVSCSRSVPGNLCSLPRTRPRSGQLESFSPPLFPLPPPVDIYYGIIWLVFCLWS